MINPKRTSKAFRICLEQDIAALPAIDCGREMARRDELVQAIYRCRPFDLDTSSSERSSLTIALLTEQPIAGITVEDMRFGGNAQRSEAARAKHVA